MKIKSKVSSRKKATSVLEEADKLVSEDRQKQYGHPVSNWNHVASIASSILKKNLTAEDCVVILLATKLSREIFKTKRDNLVDAAGYIKIWNMLKESDFVVSDEFKRCK